MIIGAHTIIYSKKAEEDRAFVRDVLGLSGVDVGGGWMIFALPPSELAFHPHEQNDQHEIYLICEDVDVFVRTMKKRRVKCRPIEDQRWGRVTSVQLPGGGQLGVYQAHHARPKAPSKRGASKRAAARPRATATKTKTKTKTTKKTKSSR
jgi:hypothetical protein